MAATISNFTLILVALFLLGAWASQATTHTREEASMLKRHEEWMVRYGRSYKDNAEKAKRFQIFKENVEFIESFNKAGTLSYKLGINQFTDLTNEEFRATMLNEEKPPPLPKPSKPASIQNESLAQLQNQYLDWREMGAVTDIKDQGPTCAESGRCRPYTCRDDRAYRAGKWISSAKCDRSFLLTVPGDFSNATELSFDQNGEDLDSCHQLEGGRGMHAGTSAQNELTASPVVGKISHARTKPAINHHWEFNLFLLWKASDREIVLIACHLYPSSSGTTVTVLMEAVVGSDSRIGECI
nr:senescence-specific cysteine protease SAG39-like [Ipomoea batatas]